MFLIKIKLLIMIFFVTATSSVLIMRDIGTIDESYNAFKPQPIKEEQHGF